MTAELITDDMRDTCIEAHATIIQLQVANAVLRSDLDEARSMILLRDLMLSCVLPIAERNAIGVDIRTCELVRSTLGKPPRQHKKPVLAVVKTEDAAP